MEVPINYLAVLVAAIANMVVGFLWYGPLFGKPWADMMGLKFDSPEAKMAMQKKALPSYAASFVGALIMACVLAHLLVYSSSYMGVSGVSAGLSAGFWSWLGFVAPVTVGIVFWEQKPWKLWFINAGYWLVTMLVMGVVLATWM
ncbi:DUF1761 domain-containing protein [bacterium]|nr:DUF1761 domain-containing protein [bacterium]